MYAPIVKNTVPRAAQSAPNATILDLLVFTSFILPPPLLAKFQHIRFAYHIMRANAASIALF